MFITPRAALGVLLVLIAIGIGITVFLIRGKEPTPLPAPPVEEVAETSRVIGKSVEGRAIEAFMYGTGDAHLVFVGGIHGGYEWNSVLLAYTLMDYLTANPDTIPKDVRVTVIPNANPDGVFKIVGKEGRFTVIDVAAGDQSAGRFNARGVDLNRNFDCKWQPEATWRGNKVSAGTAAFSEPESAALRDFFQAEKPEAAVFFHSQANAVYGSECTGGVLPETRVLLNTYATAAKYPAVSAFDAYPITGDVEGWLASIGIPAISVELVSHEAIEWEKNKLGIEAVMKHFGAATTSQN